MTDYAERSNKINELIAAIKEKFAPRITALQQRGQQMQEDFKEPSKAGAVIGVDFDVQWKKVDLIFDVPSVTIKQQSIKFDLPETTMKLQAISWDMPAICMELVEIGPVKFHVPKPCMRRQEIKLHLPEFTMKTQEIIMGVPEFGTERVKWVLSLPQFTAKNVKVEIDRMKDEGEKLQQEGETLANEMKAEVDAVIAAAYGDTASVKTAYDDTLLKVSAGIDAAVLAGVDPIKIPTENGNVNLRKQYEDLLTQRDQAIATVEGKGMKNADGKPLVRIEPASA